MPDNYCKIILKNWLKKIRVLFFLSTRNEFVDFFEHTKIFAEVSYNFEIVVFELFIN